MRKTMTKEVTTTTAKVAKMAIENGVPVAQPLADEKLLGNVTLEKAQKDIQKKFAEPVNVYEVQAETIVYEMPVEEFIQIATVKQDVPEGQEELPLA